MKERANKLTFEICAELVAYEISNMFRKTINRNQNTHNGGSEGGKARHK